MANVLLSAKNIKIRFGGVIAADGIDLDVLEGENLAIIGPNGAGKTTFLNISTGYLRPQAGTVSFLGHDITAQLPRTITKLGIARAFQIPQLFLDQTVMENMLIAAASLRGRPSGFQALSRMPEVAEMERLLDLVGVKIVRRTNSAGAARGATQACRYRARARAEAKTPADGRADLGRCVVRETRHHGHSHHGARKGESHLGLRRARHGHGGALRQPRRRVECRQNPEGRHAGGGSGRPKGA